MYILIVIVILIIFDSEKILYLNMCIFNSGFLDLICWRINIIKRIVLLMIVERIIEFV